MFNSRPDRTSNLAIEATQQQATARVLSSHREAAANMNENNKKQSREWSDEHTALMLEKFKSYDSNDGQDGWNPSATPSELEQIWCELYPPDYKTNASLDTIFHTGPHISKKKFKEHYSKKSQSFKLGQLKQTDHRRVPRTANNNNESGRFCIIFYCCVVVLFCLDPLPHHFSSTIEMNDVVPTNTDTETTNDNDDAPNGELTMTLPYVGATYRIGSAALLKMTTRHHAIIQTLSGWVPDNEEGDYARLSDDGRTLFLKFTCSQTLLDPSSLLLTHPVLKKIYKRQQWGPHPAMTALAEAVRKVKETNAGSQPRMLCRIILPSSFASISMIEGVDEDEDGALVSIVIMALVSMSFSYLLISYEISSPVVLSL